MTGLTLRGGELVDITISGARVVDTAIGMLAVTYMDGEDEFRVELAMTSAVAVTRVAPAEWPPQTGDLWRDRNGELWLGTNKYSGVTGKNVWMISDHGSDHASSLLTDRGPMILVHREPRDADTVTALLAEAVPS